MYSHVEQFAKIQQIVDNFANYHGLIWGICSGKPLESGLEILRNAVVPFVTYDIEHRINPAKTMSNVGSIIFLGKSYFYKIPKYDPLDIRGYIALGAIGQDYHITLMHLLHELAYILQEAAPFQYQSYVDTGPLWERAFAYQAGLGFIGRNGSMISQTLGSFFHIGYLMTTLPSPVHPLSPPLSSQCDSCKLCIQSCPAKALNHQGGLDIQRCVAYLTQRKGFLETYEMKWMKKYLYGCDICQLVCPFNKKLQGCYADKPAVRPLLKDILQMSNRDFKNHFGHTAAGWRGKKNIWRNALVALGNTLSEEAPLIINDFMQKHRDDLLLCDTAQKALALWHLAKERW